MPYTVLARYDQDAEEFRDIKVMEGNPTLRDAVSSKSLPTSLTFFVPEDGTEMLLLLLLLLLLSFVYLFLLLFTMFALHGSP